MTSKRHDSKLYRRQLIIRGLIYGTLALLIFAAAASGDPNRSTVTLSDIAFINGSPVKLRGYGLVVGLAGTGDGCAIGHSDRSLLAAIRRLGIDTHEYPISSGQVAAVLVQSELSPGIDLNQPLPVRLTALADATDLLGGRLLPVTLTSCDGQFTGTAAGFVLEPHNFPLGLAPAAAVIEGALRAQTSVFTSVIPDRDFVVEVRGLDSARITALATLINARFGQIARVHSGCDIEINLPEAYSDPEERAELVTQLAEMPVDALLPELLVERDTPLPEIR